MVVVVVVVVVVGGVVPEKRVLHNYLCNLCDLRILSDTLLFDFNLFLREGVKVTLLTWYRKVFLSMINFSFLTFITQHLTDGELIVIARPVKPSCITIILGCQIIITSTSFSSRIRLT